MSSEPLEIVPLGNPLSPTALAMGDYVATHPLDEAARLAYIGALTECDNEFLAMWQMGEVYLMRAMREMVASLGIPAHLMK